MKLRLILGWLLNARQKSYAAGAAIAIEAAMILTVVGIQRGLKSDPTFARLSFTQWTTVLLLMVVGLGFLFIAIERYFSVLERAQEFGILRVLGAGTEYYCSLLLAEALVISGPPTLVGVGLMYLIREGMKIGLSEFLKLDIAYMWWVIALAIVVTAALIGSGIGALKAVRAGVVQALSYEDD